MKRTYHAQIKVSDKAFPAKTIAENKNDAYDRIVSAAASRFPNERVHILEVKPEVYIMNGFLAVVVVILASLVLSSCEERETLLTLEERLQGMWVRDWIDFDTNMLFSDGVCVACANIPDTQPHCWNYAYTTKDDTLTMIDLVSRKKQVCTVTFPTDSTATLWFSGGINYYLRQL